MFQIRPSSAFLAAVLSPWLAVACVIPPRHAERIDGGLVRAPTGALARAAAGSVAQERARLSAVLPDLIAGPVEVWLQERPSAGPFVHVGDSEGFTIHRDGRAPRVHVPVDDYRPILVHELVHALLGPSWAPLPQVLEEGLGDLLCMDLAGPELEEARLRAAARAGNTTTIGVHMVVRLPGHSPQGSYSFWGYGSSDKPASGLDLESLLALENGREWLDLPPGEVEHAYGVGYLLASRIARSRGPGALHALCSEATAEGLEGVPPERVLAAAGLDGEEHLLSVARAELRRVRIARALSHETFAAAVGEAMRIAAVDRDDPVRGLERFFAVVEATLEVAEEDFPFAELPGFRAWAFENWDALSAGVPAPRNGAGR